MGKFVKGNVGKKKGTVNKFTKTVKETFQSVFNDLQANPETELKTFAINHPVEFHKIVSKLIPTDVQAEIKGTINVPITGMVIK